MAADGSIIFDVGLGTKPLAKDMSSTISKVKQFASNFGKALSSSTRGSEKQIEQLTQKYARQTEAIARQEAAIQRLESRRSEFNTKSQADIDAQTAKVERLTEQLNKMQEGGRNKLQIEEELKATEAAADSLREKYRALNDQRKKLADSLRNMPEGERRQEGLGILSQAQQVARDRLNEMDALRRKANELRVELAGIKVEPDTTKVKKLEADLSAATSKLDLLRQKSVDTGASLSRDLGLGTEKLERLKNEAGATETKLSQIQEAPEKTNTAFSRLVGGVKKFGGAIGSAFSKGVQLGGRFIKSLRNIGSRLSDVFKRTNKAGGAFDNLRKRMLRLVSAALVFNVIRKGLRELTDYLWKAMRTNQQFVNSLALIKGNLLTAFQPIFDAIMPALNALMNVLARVTAYIAAFVNLVFGKSIKASQDAAKGLHDQANALDGVGASAKKAAGALAAFDEINVLSQDGGGGGAGGIVPDFTYEFGDIENWFEQFESWPERFYELGKKIAQAIADALADIDWTKIKQRARIIAASIASFINGFIDTPEFWFQIGRTIAEGLNTAMEFAEEFADTLDWRGLGEMLAYGLNTAIEYWDAELAGRAIYKNLNGILNTIYAFFSNTRWDELGRKFATGMNAIVTGTDWDLLGRSLGSQFNALLNFLNQTVTTFDWKRLGTNIAFALNGLFYEIDWSKIGETVSTGVIGILNTLTTLIQNTDWNYLGQSITEGISSIDFGGITNALWEGIGSAVGGLFMLLKGLFSGEGGGFDLWGYINENMINAFLEGFNTTTAAANRFSEDISAATRSMLNPLINNAEEARRKLTQLFVDGKPIVAEDTAEISGYFKDMADTAIDSLERMRRSSIENLAAIFGEEAQNYEDRIAEANKSYDAMIAEIERKDRALEESVRIAKVQFGEESAEYATAVSELESHNASRIDSINRIDQARAEELQHIKDNASEEVQTYIKATEDINSDFDRREETISEAYNRMQQELKNYLEEGGSIEDQAYKDMLEKNNQYLFDLEDSLVTNADERLALQESTDKALLDETKKYFTNAESEFDSGGNDLIDSMDETGKNMKKSFIQRLGEIVLEALRIFREIKDEWDRLWDKTSGSSSGSRGGSRSSRSVSPFSSLSLSPMAALSDIPAVPRVATPAFATGSVTPMTAQFQSAIGGQRNQPYASRADIDSAVDQRVSAATGSLQSDIRELISAVESLAGRPNVIEIDGEPVFRAYNRTAASHGKGLIKGVMSR